MKILAIDTSNNTLGVSILNGNTIAGEFITNVKKNHSVRAMPAIEQLMKDCEMKPKELDKIVVAKGPGSYTGVRIGVTIAKTLAWTLNIPISGVSSLKVLAMNGKYFDGYIVPLFDGRRGQIFTGLYEWKNNELVCVKEDRLVQSSEFAEELLQLERPVLFIGNDIDIHRETLQTILGEQAVFADVTQQNPRPSALAFLGSLAAEENVHEFVPEYLRLAEAEANWIQQQKQAGENLEKDGM
ncbi:tRNA (adenosine(37)-N6)-threonylcarbamoyltransferase complex dimerization subunit type 1 TsaB [Bacillus sp. AGMB 02131]|uniref:tRNA (Adenosine(37)-N6)-threonylcarbamoyltransferase complex dimerization subunit type 1 TsaB n=1 Tax=Peribacillus faecalis TaxID=2772559 RepID=A0A927CYW1_9BACI|nr:tRNA (adenosine(37)-N6)-threonylcarbamoyltransferase complex dimerization subunit type 1 TsaB [Peribacillus faecalis]MBD3110238.1 tRNA (adenosine(37)-N6)-threonylcarbamoyltransferase complex dimerization subunit type 1 TsaB [Peribacillus faecalis]